MLDNYSFIPLDQVDHTDVKSNIVLDEKTLIRRSILPGGVTVLTEKIPATFSASIGCWFPLGSRDENEEIYGSTHFLEHLLFKGTNTRSAQDIAQSFDSVGGENNAATAKEYTAYYARVLCEHLPMACEILLDMVTSSTIEHKEFETEKKVIIDELAMGLDDLNEVVYEKFSEQIFMNHPLGRPVGGTYETINLVQRESVLNHYYSNYSSDKLVVVATGNVNHDELCELVLKYLAKGGWDISSSKVPYRRSKDLKEIPINAQKHFIEKDSQQNHVLLGTQGFNVTDERLIVMSVVNSALGGGMSSRLFQEIREKRGLAYTTYAFDTAYSDNGIFGMYAGCNADSTNEVTNLMLEQLHDIADKGLSETELEMTRGQLKGTMLMGLEDNTSRMGRLARSELIFGRYICVDETIKRINSVTVEDTKVLAEEIVSRPMVNVVLGK